MKLTEFQSLLAEKYGAVGAQAARNLEAFLTGPVPSAFPEIVSRHLEPECLGLVFDAFWQWLPFGTGGRRGRVGYGPNRFNPTTVAMTVQGHCNYLKSFSAGQELKVVVANDVRVFNDLAGTYRFLGGPHPMLGVSSRSLARMACEIYAGNGVAAYIAEPLSDSALLSTPELSFLIGQLGTVGGVNLSASHNPPDDNGIKIYDQAGSQPVPPDDQMLLDIMSAVRDVRSVPFQSALSTGLVRPIPNNLHERYVQTYVDLYANLRRPDPDVPIVYTPLCGTGLTTVGDVLNRLGFPVQTPPAEFPDGTFAVIPLKAPNPEVPQATDPAKAFAETCGSTIVLSSDPDADRVGAEIRLKDGGWYHVDGNQIATILCYFLMLDRDGPQRRGLVIETLVTTRILGRIVERSPGSVIVDDLLVGFKYVADVLKTLQRTGRWKDIRCTPNQLVLATEESHGVVLVPTILDKDSTPACMYLAILHQMLLKQGRTLLDYYVAILEEVGGFDSYSRSITMVGAEGVFKRDRIMASLRRDPPRAIAGQAVRRMVDHWDQTNRPFVSESDKLPRNVLQIFTDRFILTVRPSGTEPKLKVYSELLPDPGESLPSGLQLLPFLRARSEETVLAAYSDLLSRIDIQIGPAALLLPDVVDLDRKLDFESRILPQLTARLAGDGFADLESALDWLRKEAAPVIPGADPLPALRASIRYALAGKRDSIGLSRWAQ